jgi:ribose 5-phosphate isomerase RpiB
MTELEVRRPVPLRSVGGVELAAVGRWHASTGWITFTDEDFANAVAALQCPGVRNPVIKAGHMEEDSGSGIRWDGEPALGWIGNMHVDGAKLIGDYMGMPAWLTEADDNGMSVLASAYPDRSIEIYQPFLCQIGHLHPAVITAVAILGAYAPGVGVLKSMQDVYATYTEPMPGDTVTAAAAMLSTTIPIRLAADSPRDLNDAERQATTDFVALQASWQDALDELLAEWPDISTTQRDELTAQVQAAVDDDRTDDLAVLVVGTGVAAAALAARMSAVATAACAEQIAEAARQGVTVEMPVIDDKALTELAATVTAVMGASTASAAGRTAAQLIGTGDGKAIASLVGEHLTGYGDRFLRDQLGGALSAAQARGRWSVIEVAPLAEYYASERLDVNSCAPCRSIDGERFTSRDDAQAAYGSGKYVSCLGGSRCRGQLVSVWGDNLSAPTGRVRTTVRLSIGDHHAH